MSASFGNGHLAIRVKEAIGGKEMEGHNQTGEKVIISDGKTTMMEAISEP